jgi:ribonuclease T1
VFFSGQPQWWQALRKTGLFLTVAVAAVLSTGPALAKGPFGGSADLDSVMLSQLPPEARTTYRLILAGGPFSHHQDGVVFGNRERILPREPRGFYHEYTVDTPGSRDRGARRIVCGGTQRTSPDACFYTGDHYSTFKQIVQ